MKHAHHTALIGIDGGGTNCRFALLHGGRRYDVRLGSANATSDRAATIETLRHGLGDLATAAGLTLSDLSDVPTHIGLAGVVDRNVAIDLARALPLSKVMVEDDRRTAVVGALGAYDGCVVGIGTGSFLARRADGVDRLVGGWGLILGDEASGAYLGRELLRRVMDVRDGIVAPSPLVQDILTTFGSTSAIVDFAARAKPGDFAQYAPSIVTAAANADPIAVALMEDGARYIEHTLKQLGWQSGERICLLGGLAPHYVPYLAPEIAEYLSAPQGTALDGALILAAELATLGETE